MNEEKENNKALFIYLTPSLPITLDPAVAYDSSSTTAIQNIYETLVTYEGSEVKVVVPALAERWAITPDGLRYIFWLRSGVQFHNGHRLNAEAVAFSLERVLRMNQGPAWILGQCLREESIRVLDELIVEMNLEQPFPALLHCLAHPVASVIDPAIVEMNANRLPSQENAWTTGLAIGTGPFYLGNWAPDEGYSLLRNNHYWRTPGRLAEIRLLQVSEEAERKQRLLHGQANMAELSAMEAFRLADKPGITVVSGLRLDREMIGFNCRNAPFSDVRCRQAVMYAIDTDILLNLEPGYPMLPTSGPIPSMIYQEDEKRTFSTRQLGRAKRLLYEAGWGDGFATILGINAEASHRRRIAEAVAQCLEQVGIQIRIEAFPWAEFLKKLDTGFLPMFSWNWVPDYPDPYSYVHPLYYSDSPENKAGYQDPAMDAWLQAARRETRLEVRASLYRKIQQLAIQNDPYLFMPQGTDFVAFRDCVRGFVYNPINQVGDPTLFYPLSIDSTFAKNERI